MSKSLLHDSAVPCWVFEIQNRRNPAFVFLAGTACDELGRVVTGPTFSYSGQKAEGLSIALRQLHTVLLLLLPTLFTSWYAL